MAKILEMKENWIGILLILLFLASTALLILFLQNRGRLSPEWSRKLLHISSGLASLSFPFIFTQNWPVFVISGGGIIFVLCVKKISSLKKSIGKITGSVSRKSEGEIFFPIGTAVLFWLSKGNTVLYIIPLLILTFADTAAALIGIFYGTFKYDATGGKKSMEGSMAFFLTAFFSAHIPLLVFTNTGRIQTLLISALLGFFLMIVEAVSWDGIDNLFIPLAGFFLLKAFLQMTLPGLAASLAATAFLAAAALFLKRQSILNTGALMGAVLAAYLCWFIGGIQWILVLFIFFAAYLFLTPKSKEDWKHHYNVHSVLSTCGSGLLWLLLSSHFKHPDYLYPFTASLSSQLAMISTARQIRTQSKLSLTGKIILSILEGWLLMLIPIFILRGSHTAAQLILSFVGTSASAAAFYFTQPDLEQYPEDTSRWMRQFLFGLLASLIDFWAV
jgi:phytol kinase